MGGYGQNTEGGEFMSACMYWDFFCVGVGGALTFITGATRKKKTHGILGKLASFWEQSLLFNITAAHND